MKLPEYALMKMHVVCSPWRIVNNLCPPANVRERRLNQSCKANPTDAAGTTSDGMRASTIRELFSLGDAGGNWGTGLIRKTVSGLKR